MQSIGGVGGLLSHELQPVIVAHLEVEEALDDVVAAHLSRMLLHIGAYLLRHRLGSLAGLLHIGEHHQGVVALEFLAGVLQNNAFCIGLDVVKSL